MKRKKTRTSGCGFDRVGVTKNDGRAVFFCVIREQVLVALRVKIAAAP